MPPLGILSTCSSPWRPAAPGAGAIVATTGTFIMHAAFGRCSARLQQAAKQHCVDISKPKPGRSTQDDVLKDAAVRCGEGADSQTCLGACAAPAQGSAAASEPRQRLQPPARAFWQTLPQSAACHGPRRAGQAERQRCAVLSCSQGRAFDNSRSSKYLQNGVLCGRQGA